MLQPLRSCAEARLLGHVQRGASHPLPGLVNQVRELPWEEMIVDQVAKSKSVGERVFKEDHGGISREREAFLVGRYYLLSNSKQEPRCNEHQFCECN